MTHRVEEAGEGRNRISGWSSRLVLAGRRRPWVAGIVCLAVVLVAGAGVVAAGGRNHTPAISTAGLPAQANTGNGSAGSATSGQATFNTNGGVGQASASGSASAGAPAAALSGSAPAQVGGLPDEVPAFQSKVVKTGMLQLQVASGAVPKTVSQLTTDVNGLGGYVASSSQSSGTTASGDVSLRVPVASFDALVAQAKQLGTTVSLSTSGQDVTAQYVDLQARIDSLQAARSQFEQILARAQSIGDILSVEAQISDVQTQVEQLQGQLDVLNDQATYSTLAVQLSEAGKPAPPRPPKPPSGVSRAWSHAIHSFAHGAESILAASGGIALFIVTVGIFLLIARLAWIGIRRRTA